jgi:hypothetical protein
LGLNHCRDENWRVIDRYLALEKTYETVNDKKPVFLQQALLTRPLGIVLRGRFSYVTTSKKKSAFLLIETFRKPFNPQNDGHQDSILCGHNFFQSLA